LLSEAGLGEETHRVVYKWAQKPIMDQSKTTRLKIGESHGHTRPEVSKL